MCSTNLAPSSDQKRERKVETIIEIRDEWIERLAAMLESVRKKDSSFLFEWRKDPKSGAKGVVIFGKDVAQTHRRALFTKRFIADVFGIKISYTPPQEVDG